jgi:hypothetical protein
MTTRKTKAPVKKTTKSIIKNPKELIRENKTEVIIPPPEIIKIIDINRNKKKEKDEQIKFISERDLESMIYADVISLQLKSITKQNKQTLLYLILILGFVLIIYTTTCL